MGATVCFTFDHLGDLNPFFDLLDRHDVRGTFFVQGEFGQSEPERVAGIVERGHHLGMHGWAHEAWADLDEAEERELAAKATDALTAAAGVAPAGFRAPEGSRSERTAEILGDLGYTYDASLGDGATPGVLADGLAQVPFVWDAVDGAYYLRPEPAEPDEVRRSWLDLLGGQLFVPICHAEITGADGARLAVLDEVMGAAVADSSIRVCTVAEVAEEVLA